MTVRDLMSFVEEETFVMFEEPEAIGTLAAGIAPMDTDEINDREVLSVYASTLTASGRAVLCVVVKE